MMILCVLISSIITQWKVACLQKQHARWRKKLKIETEEILDKVQASELRRTELLQEVKELRDLMVLLHISTDLELLLPIRDSPSLHNSTLPS